MTLYDDNNNNNNNDNHNIQILYFLLSRIVN